MDKASNDIIRVLKDKKLLGQFIEDPKTWRAWFTFLRAFFALRPIRGDKTLFNECTGRENWPTEPAKEAWLAVGVRGGKSFVVALISTFLAVFREHKLSAGERGYILIVAPTKRQAGIIKKYLSSFFHDNEFLSPYLVRETSDEVELSNNIVIAVLSSDYRSLRGYTGVAAIVDEVAFLSVEGSKPDTEVVRALRSRLTSTGGPLICISSPYAKRGELYNVHKKHFGKDGSNILVWQAPSLLMNPTLDKEAIGQAHEEDPEAAKADYDALFRSDIESFVSREAVEACVIPGRLSVPPTERMRYLCFTDPSGGQRDSFTLAIAHVENRRFVLDCLHEIRAPFSPDQAVRELAGILKRYNLRQVIGDRYGGQWPAARFNAHGIRYRVSSMVKSDLYRELLPIINSGEVKLLDNPRLIKQFCNLERRTGRSGKDSIDHPPNQMDDLINAAAGAIVTLTKVKRVGSLAPSREHRRLMRKKYGTEIQLFRPYAMPSVDWHRR